MSGEADIRQLLGACRQPLHVIGCGALGSPVVLQLARALPRGRRLDVWDADRVEEKNLHNQAFHAAHVGMLKVEAIAELAAMANGGQVIAHAEEVVAETTLAGVVFVLTHSMKSRMAIWQRCLRANPEVPLVVEARLGMTEYRVYAVDPSNRSQAAAYETTFYDDPPLPVGVCHAPSPIGATAIVAAGVAVSQFMNWLRVTCGGAEFTLQNEVVGDLTTFRTITRVF